MSLPAMSRRALLLVAAIVPLVLLFAYVAVRSGPLAPTEVTTVGVAKRSITPALSGIGTVQARYSYRIGPTYAGRLQRLDVHVGDAVKAGQVLGAMAPVDLDDRIGAQQAAIASARAALQQAQARQRYAHAQAQRYAQLAQQQLVSAETASARRQELDVANAGLAAARNDIRRLQAERDAVQAQRGNLALVAPVDGLVVARNADPGTNTDRRPMLANGPDGSRDHQSKTNQKHRHAARRRGRALTGPHMVGIGHRCISKVDIN